jgi:hypothetical protein
MWAVRKNSTGKYWNIRVSGFRANDLEAALLFDSKPCINDGETAVPVDVTVKEAKG